MRITGVDVIRNGERDLMEAITADLDWGAVEGIFRENHHLSLEEEIEYKKGDIVVHEDRVAYRLDFLAKVTLSVLLDREGHHLSVEVNGSTSNLEGAPEKGFPDGSGQRQRETEEGYEKVISRLGSD